MMNQCVKITLVVKASRALLCNLIKKNAERLAIEGIGNIEGPDTIKIVANGTNDSIDEFIDVIICRNALDHVDNPAKTAREISRVLKPGGLFVLVVDIKERRTSCEPSPIHGPEIINDLFQDFIIEFQDIREIPHYVKFLKHKDIVRPTYYGRLRKNGK